MKIFFAGGTTHKLYRDLLYKNRVRRVLISYQNTPFTKDLVDKLSCWEEIMVDSGAFSIWMSGKKVDLDEYIQYCKKLKGTGLKFHFVNLDVIPGRYGVRPTKEEREQSAEEGWKNMEKMKKEGLNCIHVFHQHEDFKWLRKMMEFDYIGISPANDVSLKQKRIWLDNVFSLIKGTVKTHAFGLTDKNLMLRYPWYSMDSTTWFAPIRYGQSSVGTKSLEEQGLKRRVQQHSFFACKQDIRTLLDREKLATELWRRRGIVWKD